MKQDAYWECQDELDAEDVDDEDEDDENDEDDEDEADEFEFACRDCKPKSRTQNA